MDRKVKKNINSRNEIEWVLVEFSYSYYSKVKESRAYKDKIMTTMNRNDIRDRILKG